MNIIVVAVGFFKAKQKIEAMLPRIFQRRLRRRVAVFGDDALKKILYHLAQNPEQVYKLNAMTVSGALRELGKLEAKLEKPAEKAEAKPEKEHSAAPAPIKPLKGGNAPQLPVDEKGEFTGSISEFKRLRREGKLK